MLKREATITKDEGRQDGVGTASVTLADWKHQGKVRQRGRTSWESEKTAHAT